MSDPARPLKSRSRIVTFTDCEVWFLNDQIVVDSRAPLPDLVLREFGRPRVGFEGAWYYVSEKSVSSDKPVLYRYVLTPWPKGDESVTRRVVLDAGYFAELAGERQLRLREGMLFKVLVPFYPFLGFLWSPQKRFLNGVGLEAHALSSLSIYVGFIAGFACGVFVVIFEFGSKIISVPLLSGMVTLMLDAAIRYHRLLAGEDSVPPGFYEWLLRRRNRYE